MPSSIHTMDGSLHPRRERPAVYEDLPKPPWKSGALAPRQIQENSRALAPVPVLLFPLGPFLDPQQLMRPQPLKCPRPFIRWTEASTLDASGPPSTRICRNHRGRAAL